jgi:molecular chaperone DnaK
VAPASLGVQTVGGFTEHVLGKNLPIPLERARTFSTAADHQTRVEIACCRGEQRRFADNESLGALVLEGLEKRPRGEVEIEVTFAVDADGILSVSAVNLATGEAQQAYLTVHGAPDEGDAAPHPAGSAP